MVWLICVIFKEAEGTYQDIQKQIESAQECTDLSDGCQRLLDKFNYFKDMRPLINVILKYSRGDWKKASQRIEEGRVAGQSASNLLGLCAKIKDRFQHHFRMVLLVYVIYKYAKEDHEEALKQICTAHLEVGKAIRDIRYSYELSCARLCPRLYTSAAPIYSPLHMSSFPMYQPYVQTPVLLVPPLPCSTSSPSPSSNPPQQLTYYTPDAEVVQTVPILNQPNYYVKENKIVL